MFDPIVTRFVVLPGNIRGAVWIVMAGMCFTGVGALIKFLGQDLPFLQVAFFRCVLGAIFVIPGLVRHNFVAFKSRRHFDHFWRAALGTTGMALSMYSLTHLALSDATAISFSAPLFVLIVAALFLGEKVRWRRWTATAVGFAGVLVMMRPGQGAFDPVMLVALAAAATAAGAVCVVKSLTATESTSTMLGMFSLWSALFMAVPAAFVWREPTLEQWLLGLLLGFLATLGQSCNIRGYSAGEATAIAAFDYLRLPFAVVVGVWLFAELPSLWTLAGALLIVGSTLYIAVREARLRRGAADVR